VGHCTALFIGGVATTSAHSLLKTIWIAYGVAKGMYYLHSQFPVVIHRDLKSPNILLGTNVREVKITDFGLSRLRVESYVDTGPGGTPEWMAPELLRQDPFDEQSDVFSFGVILWELVMCEKPWKEDHPMQIGMSIVTLCSAVHGACVHPFGLADNLTCVANRCPTFITQYTRLAPAIKHFQRHRPKCASQRFVR
jgi:serine/threonine protein kinase